MHTPVIAANAQLKSLAEVLDWPLLARWRLSGATLSSWLALCAYALFLRTRHAVAFRAVGANALAADFAGHSVGRIRFIAVLCGGALAGIASVQEILFHSHKFYDGFAAGLGYTGIAVSLLFGTSASSIGLAALLFGTMQAAMVGLQISGVSQATGVALQGAVLLVVLWMRAERGRPLG